MRKIFIVIMVINLLIVGCNNTNISDIAPEDNEKVKDLKNKIEVLESEK